ncbi:rCG26240 [Rattus norvegicus]|uniref:RCG26240 n=1 Tax=Rattus norvegicus TaxID=10116 RepID=A6HP64_RAT|nr:rCG26240 [Rattus norvegicus]
MRHGILGRLNDHQSGSPPSVWVSTIRLGLHSGFQLPVRCVSCSPFRLLMGTNTGSSYTEHSLLPSFFRLMCHT